jgi:hypothetical protein
MPSNTERDDLVSDNGEDRVIVGRGHIANKKLGSANASDASYFVPLRALAGGWDGKEDEANGYAAYPGADDYFIVLQSMTAMTPRRRAY